MNINDEVNTVSSVHFGILSHEQILKMSCVEITENKYYDSNGEPNLNSLFDPRMGVIERGRNCKTCEQNFIDCPGHFGHINLAKPVYNVKYSDIYKKILTCICPRCGKLSLNKNSAQLKILLKQTEGKFKERFDIIYDLCSKVSRCGVLDEDEKDSLYDNQGCGAIKPSRINQKTIIEGFITLEWANAKSKDEGNEPITKQMDATYILNLFSRISEEDSMAMGFNKNWCLPHYLIIQSVVVIPPACRPSVRQYNGQRSEDDITVKYCEIIKYNNEIKNFLKEDTVNSKKLDISMSNMQFHINAIIDNDGPYPQKSQTRNGRDIKSLSERLNGKEGRIRSNLMGKRVDFSARSVISPESNVDMSELCIPKEFAMNLTFPEKVNRFNIQKMYKLVRNGNKVYPGAKSIKQVKTGKLTKLLENNTENIVLEYGDVINRHLQDGDYVLFNRQPSLHRMSMMGHKVRIMPGKTMRFNTDVCNPYNADFDGDEMNIHVPQSIQAKSELKYLAAVPNHFISPSDNSPIIAPTQDNLLALFLITNGDVLFTQIEAMHFLSGCESFDGTLPEPKIREGKYIRWTGHQILSCILPPFTLNSGGVKILNGELKSGQIAKSVNGQIIQAIHDEFGPKITERYMNDLQRVCSRYLIKNGYSVGISDLVLPESVKTQNKDFVKKAKEQEIELNRKLHLNILTNSKNVLQEYETQLTNIQKKTDETIQKNTVSKLNINNNRVYCMVKSGAKGKDINIKQMMCLLGQQAIDGGRVPINFTDRTLPHFPRFDYGLESGGFIVNNYLEGLSPTEFFFHGMSGREGLIDTAVKTATSGYLQRKLVKSMEDLKANYDLSVRDNNGDVIEFLYGSDGFDPVRIGKHKTNFEFITEDNLMNNYIIRENEKFENYMTKKAIDTMKKDKEWFNKLNEYNHNVQEVLDILHTKYTIFKYSDTKFNNRSIESDLFLPVNIKKLIDKVNGIYHLSEIKTKSSLTPVEVYDVINEILIKCANNGVVNNVLRVMLYDLLSPKKIIRDNKFNRLALDHLKNLIITGIQKASVSAGEMVGVISGQSIGEVSTQLTLNTFHLAGTGNKATSGVIRVNELIGVRKNIKAPSNLVYLKDEFRFDKDKAEKVKNSLEETKIEEILNSDPEFFLATSNNIEDMPEEDQTFMKFYEVFTELNASKADVNSNPWIVKLDFNRKEMLNRDISMADVHQILSINKPDANIMYSDDNAGKLVFRIKFNFNSQINIEDDYNLLREEAKNIKDLNIKGINGLTDIYVLDAAPQIHVKDTTKIDNTDIGQVYETIDEYYLKTDGANLLELLMSDEVDSNRSFTIDPNEMNMIFGIEMARFIIVKEFCDTVKTSPRHVELLASKMTHNGHFMSIDRYGINKEDVGPLAKISFEQVNDNIKNAALFGEVDKLRGVSGNIIVGQVPKIGTGNVRIYIDEEFLTQELKKRGIKDNNNEYDTQEINDDIILQEFQQKICVSEDEQIKLNLNDITVDDFSLADIPEVEVE